MAEGRRTDPCQSRAKAITKGSQPTGGKEPTGRIQCTIRVHPGSPGGAIKAGKLQKTSLPSIGSLSYCPNCLSPGCMESRCTARAWDGRHSGRCIDLLAPFPHNTAWEEAWQRADGMKGSVVTPAWNLEAHSLRFILRRKSKAQCTSIWISSFLGCEHRQSRPVKRPQTRQGLRTKHAT